MAARDYAEKNARDLSNILKFRAGDEAAGNALVLEYMPFINTEALRMSAIYPEDYISAGYSMLAACLGHYTPNAKVSFASYFALCLRREFRHIKDYNLRRPLSDAVFRFKKDGEDCEDAFEVHNLADPGPRPDEVLSQKEADERLFKKVLLLRKAIAALPLRERAVVTKVFFEGKTRKQVEIDLDIPSDEVAKVRKAALVKLNAALKDLPDFVEDGDPPHARGSGPSYIAEHNNHFTAV